MLRDNGLLGLLTAWYGDVLPRTPVEILFAISFMMIGSFFYAVVMGNMMTILSELNLRNAQYKIRMRHLEAYMHRMQLHPSLRNRVRDFMRYRYSKRSEYQLLEKFEGVPTTLRSHIAWGLYGNLLQTVKVFEGCSVEFLMEVAAMFTTVQLGPGDSVFERNERGNKMWIISKGQVEIELLAPHQLVAQQMHAAGSDCSETSLHSSSRQPVYTMLKSADIFGASAFLHYLKHHTDYEHHVTARALTFCDLYPIGGRPLRQVVDRCAPKEKQRILEALHQLTKYDSWTDVPADRLHSSSVDEGAPRISMSHNGDDSHSPSALDLSRRPQHLPSVVASAMRASGIGDARQENTAMAAQPSDQVACDVAKRLRELYVQLERLQERGAVAKREHHHHHHQQQQQQRMDARVAPDSAVHGLADLVHTMQEKLNSIEDKVDRMTLEHTQILDELQSFHSGGNGNPCSSAEIDADEFWQPFDLRPLAVQPTGSGWI